MNDAGNATIKVLVTGATGFIGQACVSSLLQAGCDVIGTYRGDPPAAIEGIIWQKADLTSADTLRDLCERHRPSHLLALAWYMGPGNQQAIDNFRWLQHSIDLIIAFAEAGGTRVTFCGSCMEYDWSEAKKLHETKTALRPNTEYGAAKAALFMAFGPLCHKLGLSGAWARPFFLYGPGEKPWRLAADVTISLLENREALCSHGRQKRDFLHVGDVGNAMVHLLQSDLEGPINIGSGRAISLADLVHEIGRQTGQSDLIRLGAREASPDDPPLVEADTTRLNASLKWKPEFDLERGLADTISWWRNELKRRML